MENKNDNIINDNLVDSWLKLGATLKNDRLVNIISFNETHVCNLLIRGDLTQKQIEYETNMLKSLVHRVIKSLLNKGYVKKYKKEDNMKTVWVKLTSEGIKAYNKQHEEILKFVGKLTAKLGLSETKELTRLMNEASVAGRDLLLNKGKLKE